MLNEIETCLFEIMQMKPSHLGHCYCKYKHGYPERNEIMCITDNNFEQLDLCREDEGCVGPKTPDDAKLFSRNKFCSKGGLNVLH